MVRKVLIADDSPVLRKALCQLFTTGSEFDVCAEVRSPTSEQRLPQAATRLAAASYTWSTPVLISGAGVAVGSYSMAVTRAGTFLVGWTDGNFSDSRGNVAVKLHGGRQ